MQDIQTLLDKSPEFVAHLTDIATNASAGLNHMIHGGELPQGRKLGFAEREDGVTETQRDFGEWPDNWYGHTESGLDGLEGLDGKF